MTIQLTTDELRLRQVTTPLPVPLRRSLRICGTANFGTETETEPLQWSFARMHRNQAARPERIRLSLRGKRDAQSTSSAAWARARRAAARWSSPRTQPTLMQRLRRIGIKAALVDLEGAGHRHVWGHHEGQGGNEHVRHPRARTVHTRLQLLQVPQVEVIVQRGYETKGAAGSTMRKMRIRRGERDCGAGDRRRRRSRGRSSRRAWIRRADAAFVPDVRILRGRRKEPLAVSHTGERRGGSARAERVFERGAMVVGEAAQKGVIETRAAVVEGFDKLQRADTREALSLGLAPTAAPSDAAVGSGAARRIRVAAGRVAAMLGRGILGVEHVITVERSRSWIKCLKTLVPSVVEHLLQLPLHPWTNCLPTLAPTDFLPFVQLDQVWSHSWVNCPQAVVSTAYLQVPSKSEPNNIPNASPKTVIRLRRSQHDDQRDGKDDKRRVQRLFLVRSGTSKTLPNTIKLYRIEVSLAPKFRNILSYQYCIDDKDVMETQEKETLAVIHIRGNHSTVQSPNYSPTEPPKRI
ncbi:hypothetical protein C8R45DRAFT_1157066 [Mycena sanguinolenta]|nr:hypothetical protein C8R45DRAFT_1157066 [Mycena sanguinolenta]